MYWRSQKKLRTKLNNFYRKFTRWKLNFINIKSTSSEKLPLFQNPNFDKNSLWRTFTRTISLKWNAKSLRKAFIATEKSVLVIHETLITKKTDQPLHSPMNKMTKKNSNQILRNPKRQHYHKTQTQCKIYTFYSLLSIYRLFNRID